MKKEDRRVQTVTAFPTILQSLLKELEGLADCHPVITCCISRLTLKLGMEDLAEMCKTLFIQKNLPGKLIRKGFPVRFSIPSYLKRGWKPEKSHSVPAKVGRCQGVRRLGERRGEEKGVIHFLQKFGSILSFFGRS